jgi:dCMP deaminase
MEESMSRISKESYYLNIAREVAERSPCLKMKVGAVIVKDDCIISTGYNGPTRGEEHCDICNRLDLPHRTNYENCPAVHAEENAVINAARYGSSIKGGTLYLYTGEDLYPCDRCQRVLNNAGIEEIII